MKTYYIYHIPGVKIGCTNTLKKRMKDQGFTSWEIIEEHTDIYEASDREIELQKQYGYEVDRIPYHESKRRLQKGVETSWKNATPEKKFERTSVAGKVGIKKVQEMYSKEERAAWTRKAGLSTSKEHKQSAGGIGGSKTAKKEYQCPHCNHIGVSNLMFRWHFDNCKKK